MGDLRFSALLCTARAVKKASTRKSLSKAEAPEQTSAPGPNGEKRSESREVIKPLTPEAKHRLGGLEKVIDGEPGGFFESCSSCARSGKQERRKFFPDFLTSRVISFQIAKAPGCGCGSP
jgi:hypothetical protein